MTRDLERYAQPDAMDKCLCGHGKCAHRESRGECEDCWPYSTGACKEFRSRELRERQDMAEFVARMRQFYKNLDRYDELMKEEQK